MILFFKICNLFKRNFKINLKNKLMMILIIFKKFSKQIKNKGNGNILKVGIQLFYSQEEKQKKPVLLFYLFLYFIIFN